MPKNVKGGPFGVFEHPFFCKMEKNEGGTCGDIKTICEKKSHKAEITCTKKIRHGRDSNPSFCLADLKNPQKKQKNYISVAVSGSQLIKLIKSVTSFVL